MLSPRGVPKTPTPKQDFNQQLQDAKREGLKPVSDMRKKSGRVVTFADGGKLRLLNTGHMVRDYADGKKFQRNPDGKGITIEPDGTKIQQNPNGNLVVQHNDGTTITHTSTGEKIFVYPDGTTKQVELDGSGILVDGSGERTDFGYGEEETIDKVRYAMEQSAQEQAEREAAALQDGEDGEDGAPTEASDGDKRCFECGKDSEDRSCDKCVIM